jgi:hypothetical protein
MPSAVTATEEPRFDVVAEYDTFELRQYSPFVIAEIEIRGDFEEAGNEAFNTLLSYIRGANSGSQKMEMTAPVLQMPASVAKARGGEKMAMAAPVLQRSGVEGDSYLVSFVLPLRYRLENAPIPDDPRIMLREVPVRRVAARRYSGRWTESRYRENEGALLEAVQTAGYVAIGAPEWARYNAPFMPWFLRRNEVLVEVREAEG